MNHSQAQSRIAWYVNDTLASEERAQLSEHALSCAVCRDGIAATELLREVVAEVAEDEPAFDVSMVHAMARRLPTQRSADSESVSAQEPTQEPHQESGESPASKVVSLTDRLRKRLEWQYTPAPIRWALAAQVALIVGMAFLVAVPGGESGEPSFQTVSGPSLVADATVVWREDAPVQQINALLSAVGAEVSAGPNALGMYRLTFSGDAAAVERIAILRGSELVLYAELVAQ